MYSRLYKIIGIVIAIVIIILTISTINEEKKLPIDSNFKISKSLLFICLHPLLFLRYLLGKTISTSKDLIINYENEKIVAFSSLTIPFFILMQTQQQQVANAEPDNTNLCYYYHGMLDAMNILSRSLPPEVRSQIMSDNLDKATTTYNQNCGNLNISVPPLPPD